MASAEDDRHPAQPPRPCERLAGAAELAVEPAVPVDDERHPAFAVVQPPCAVSVSTVQPFSTNPTASSANRFGKCPRGRCADPPPRGHAVPRSHARPWPSYPIRTLTPWATEANSPSRNRRAACRPEHDARRHRRRARCEQVVGIGVGPRRSLHPVTAPLRPTTTAPTPPTPPSCARSRSSTSSASSASAPSASTPSSSPASPSTWAKAPRATGTSRSRTPTRAWSRSSARGSAAAS